MPRRAEPPREPRRGDDPPRRGSARAGIGDARSYTPRGRTVWEQARRVSWSDSGEGPAGTDGAGGERDQGVEPVPPAGWSVPRGQAGQRRTPRGRRSTDPFRPALQVLDGGRDTGRRQQIPAARASAGKGAVGAQGAKSPARPEATGLRPLPGSSARATGRRAGGTGRDGGVPVQRSRRATARGPATARRPARPPKLGEPRRRLRLATVLALLMFVAIGVRLIGLQLTDAPAYAKAGLRERLANLVLTAPRGSISDRSGAVLAHSVDARYVYADPTQVKNPAAVAAALSPELGLAPSELLPFLLRHKRADGQVSQFEYLQRGVTLETAEKITDMDLPGIYVASDERREVPGHDVAANLIGFTGEDGNGLEGMEARYDELLRGRDGELIYERGRDEEYRSAKIPGGYRKETKAKPGSSLRLTIDRDVQYTAQLVLFDACTKARASYGAAVVLDVRTGEVLAQASYPTFDAANWKESKPREREDVASRVVVDPGSVHKALVIGAALEEGVIKPSSTVVVGPRITKGDETFRDTTPNYQPREMTLPGILAYSSNIGTIKIAERLGAQKLYEYQRRFGLGQATGVGMPAESPGLVQPPANWSQTSYGSIPIGHGVSVTPLQMAAAYAAIANDGTWVQPHLIQAVIAPDGTERPAGQVQTRKVLSPANAEALRHMMEAVVSVDGATGNMARVSGYRVAGKTGTGAQVVNGQYVRGEVASFVGMAPADDPRFVVAVFAHTPGGGGGAIAGPAFSKIMSYTLGRFKVPPTGQKPPTFELYQ